MNFEEPILEKKHRITFKEIFQRYIYVFVVALVIILGTSYSLTFFVSNQKVGEVTLNVGGLTYTVSNTSINATGLTPMQDSQGLRSFSKNVIIENTSDIDGVVELSLNRDEGLELDDLRYGLVVNDVLVEVDEVPTTGEIYSTQLPPNETLNLDLHLWANEDYAGEETTFTGELAPDVGLAATLSSDLITDLENNYVNFNCLGTNCEVWRIVKVEDERLVLTKENDLEGATERENSNLYDNTISYNDSTDLVVSQSTDKKNVYLRKTVGIVDGDGTSENPYVLNNTEHNLEDEKVIAILTYDVEGVTSTQPLYLEKTNYISKTVDDAAFTGWSDGTNTYQFGDVVSFTTNTTLTAQIVRTVSVTVNIVATEGNCPWYRDGRHYICISNQGQEVENSYRTVQVNIYSDENHTQLVTTIENLESATTTLNLAPGTYYLVNAC